MIDTTTLDSMEDTIEEIRCQLAWIDECEAVDNIKGELVSLETDIDSLRPDEDCDVGDLIPSDLSLGEALSLKEAINAWRKEHGYGEIS